MDPFEEFEMKPLTEGLGFHKKAVKLKDEVKRSSLANESFGPEIPDRVPEGLLDDNRPADLKTQRQALDDLVASILSKDSDEGANASIRHENLDNSGVKITQPLPKKDQQIRAMDMEVPRSQPAMPPSPQGERKPYNPRPTYTAPIKKSDVGVRRSAADSPRGGLQPIPASIASAVLDGIVVFAFALIFLVSLILVTKVDLMSVVANSQSDFMTQLSLSVLYIAVLQMYVVVSRSFFGRTLGEWTFDYQMGTDRQINKGIYPLLVVWRSIIVVITGVVVLPILSFIVRKDLLSYLTGLQLYRRQD